MSINREPWWSSLRRLESLAEPTTYRYDADLHGEGELKIIPLSVVEAEEFLKKHDRHYKVPVEKICAVGVGEVTGTGAALVIHGAAILGRRSDGDGELAHIYVDGVSQGYSLLYGACWRILKALGYEKAAL
jgi:hypothetical protein